jgi:hypothetical protein
VSEKVVLLLGAGASVADVANSGSPRTRPPLDEKFFSVAASVDSRDRRLTAVRGYFKSTYNLDICRGEYDSMERVMAALYPDLFNKSLLDARGPPFKRCSSCSRVGWQPRPTTCARLRSDSCIGC